MISYMEAFDLIIKNACKTTTQKIPLMHALGKIAAEDVVSSMQVPSFRNSAMDGFAVCASKLKTASETNPVILKINAAISAGSPNEIGKAENTVQIMTGALIPEIYDAVVPIEAVKKEGAEVSFTKPAKLNDHVRFPGEDVEKNQCVLRRGEVINAEVIMLLSALGITEVFVAKLPLLHIISTGNEITDDYKSPLKEAQIYNSNAPYLLAAAQQNGLDARYEGIVRDEPEIFESKISALKEPAIIISTGAVSKGVWDFIPDSLNKIGAKIHFHRVNIRPGKPILFATLPNGSFYFGLPGNPISASIGFTFFVMPLIRALQWQTHEKLFIATLENNFTKKGNFRQFLKGKVWLSENGSLRARISDGQESFKISPMAANNAWVILDETKAEFQIGEQIPIALYAALIPHNCNKEAKLCPAA